MFINVEKKLFESELRLMELLWENEPASAGKLSEIAAEKIGWNKNTTYTVITKLVTKGAIARSDPGFICTSIMKRDNAVKAETDSLLRHFYGGSKKALFSALLEDESLTEKDIKELKELIKSK